MKDKYCIPHTIDEPFKFILLTIDELLVFIAPLFILGVMCNSLVTGFVLGAGLVIVIKKIKGEQGHYYLLNVLFWHLPPIVRLSATPPSHIRMYLG